MVDMGGEDYTSFTPIDEDTAVSCLKEYHGSREGRSPPPPEELGDRGERSSKDRPPATFSTAPPWTVRQMMAKVEVRRKDQTKLFGRGLVSLVQGWRTVPHGSTDPGGSSILPG